MTAWWNGGRAGKSYCHRVMVGSSLKQHKVKVSGTQRNLWRSCSRIFFSPHYWYLQPSPGTPDFQAPLCIPLHPHCSHRSCLSIPYPPNTYGGIEDTCYPHLKDYRTVAKEGSMCLRSHSEFTGKLEFKFKDPIKVLSLLPSEPTTQGTLLGVT